MDKVFEVRCAGMQRAFAEPSIPLDLPAVTCCTLSVWKSQSFDSQMTHRWQSAARTAHSWFCWAFSLDYFSSIESPYYYILNNLLAYTVVLTYLMINRRWILKIPPWVKKYYLRFMPAKLRHSEIISQEACDSPPPSDWSIHWISWIASSQPNLKTDMEILSCLALHCVWLFISSAVLFQSELLTAIFSLA